MLHTHTRFKFGERGENAYSNVTFRDIKQVGTLNATTHVDSYYGAQPEQLRNMGIALK